MVAVSTVSAGNAGDIVARVVLEQVSKQIGQSFVIENRPGAGGTLGSASVAKADPDGYTILLLTSSQALGRRAAQDSALRSGERFRAGGHVRRPAERAGGARRRRAGKPSPTSIAAAKAKPGKLNFASAGRRLRLALGRREAAARGGHRASSTSRSAARSRRFTEVMSGRIDFYFVPIAPALPNIKDGKVVALAVSTPQRAPLLPEVPTIVRGRLSGRAIPVLGRPGAAGQNAARHRRPAARRNQKALEVPAVQERLAARRRSRCR